MNLFDKEELNQGSIFIMMCGAPGSGKTTAAKTLSESSDMWTIVATDAIREELFNDRYNQEDNKQVYSTAYNRIVTGLKNGDNIIYDATNCNKHYRKKILKFAIPYANKIICYASASSLRECLERNAKRDFVVPEEAIERMYISLRKYPPSLYEGFDMIARF